MDITFGTFQMHVSAWFIIFLVLFLPLVLRLLKKLKKGPEHHDSRGHKLVPHTLGSSFDLPEQTIAIVDVRGPILTSAMGVPPFVARNATFGIETGTLIRELADNDQVAAIMVRINTPGGTVAGSEEIGDAIAEASGKKPVVAFIEDLSASGGVLAMVGAKAIVAHPSALIGSIGVLGPTLKHYEDVTALGYGLLGESVTGKVTAEVMYAGAGKALGSPFVERDEKSIEYFQALLNDSYDRFRTRVSKARHIADATLRDLGARVVSAAHAKVLGLIDMLGTEQSVLETICEGLGVDLEDANIIAVKPKPTSRTSPLSALFETTPPTSARMEVGHLLRGETLLLCAPHALRSYGFVL